MKKKSFLFNEIFYETFGIKKQQEKCFDVTEVRT